MCCGLLECFKRRSKLQYHDGNKSTEGAEEALDGSIAEGQVRQGYYGIATDFCARTGIFGIMFLVNLALNLNEQEMYVISLRK